MPVTLPACTSPTAFSEVVQGFLSALPEWHKGVPHGRHPGLNMGVQGLPVKPGNDEQKTRKPS